MSLSLSLSPGNEEVMLTVNPPLMLTNRYYIRVTISRRLTDVVKERDIWVHSYRMPPDSNNAIKMEVGIEDCLHIEFEYNKSKYVPPSPCPFLSVPSLSNPSSPCVAGIT